MLGFEAPFYEGHQARMPVNMHTMGLLYIMHNGRNIKDESLDKIPC
jgi:hypothetical protein